jgi:hypothetical protein
MRLGRAWLEPHTAVVVRTNSSRQLWYVPLHRSIYGTCHPSLRLWHVPIHRSICGTHRFVVAHTTCRSICGTYQCNAPPVVCTNNCSTCGTYQKVAPLVACNWYISLPGARMMAVAGLHMLHTEAQISRTSDDGGGRLAHVAHRGPDFQDLG